jgi:D-aminopeptidase
VTEQDCLDALQSAASGPVEEGSVGGGTGMICYEFKGGNGTASRLVSFADTAYTVGVFVQANFGSRRELTLAGLPVGELLADYTDPGAEGAPASAGSGAGSVIAIVGTDAPLLPHQCMALARRVTLGIARTGTTGSHFSGDLFLAFSTGNPGALTPGGEVMLGAVPERYDELRFVPWGFINPFYEAVVQATEEAVANVLVANEDMTGRDGHHTPALPRDRVAALLRDRTRPA